MLEMIECSGSGSAGPADTCTARHLWTRVRKMLKFRKDFSHVNDITNENTQWRY